MEQVTHVMRLMTALRDVRDNMNTARKAMQRIGALETLSNDQTAVVMLMTATVSAVDALVILASIAFKEDEARANLRASASGLPIAKKQ